MRVSLKMKKILYMHTGSGNHGCEAIIRSTSKLLDGPKDLQLWSLAKQEEVKYGADACFENIIESEQIQRFSFAYFEALFRRVVLREKDANLKVFLKKLFKGNMAISIGGDNYCYEWSANQNIRLNKIIRKYCKYSVLWACSIDAEAITEEMRDDLAQYDLITARESITYEVLSKINPNTVQVADPAFLLDKVELPLPDKFIENNTVGINVSPLIMKYGTESNIILENYKELIKYILEKTDMNICLIPHVVWEYNNDFEPIQVLFDKFKDSNRVCMLNDCNCMELKGYISRCRFFVGARTHATIAAYSSGVPTLVVGYSVKSRGIAKDLFGTEENYVLPVQELTSNMDLKDKFEWLKENEKKCVSILQKQIPMFIERAKKGITLQNCEVRK